MTRPLAGPEAVIFDLLQRVVAIGRHRRAWQARDVVRVTVEHLDAGHVTRALAEARQRADRAERRANAAEARCRQLEAQGPRAAGAADDYLPPRRVVELRPAEYECFAEFAEGRPKGAIAKELGLSPGTVANYVSHAAQLIGAETAAQAAALVNRNVVQIRMKPRSAAA